MISRDQRRPFSILALLTAAILMAACEKVPLLAPTGSSITLTSATTALPANGTATIVAQVLESSGTPPHSGTRVTFTTTLGTIDPAEVSTDASGRATVTFRAGNQSGVATIAASSGGATTSRSSSGSTNAGDGATATDGNLKIAVGSAAVGRVVLGASPTLLSSLGGNSTLTAAVTDINGNPLPSVPVIFTTTAGALSASSVSTDANGLAVTVLNTAVEATVTATAGLPTSGSGSNGSGGTTSSNSAQITIKVNPVPTLSIRPTTTGTITAGTPVIFEITATLPTGSTSQIRDMSINFGDGTRLPLGAANGTTTVQHVYNNTTTQSFTVTVTLTDTLGAVTSASTVVVVLPQPPLGVVVTYTKVSVVLPVTVNFTATVTPATATVSSYVWNFGDGQSQTTTTNTAVHTYTAASPPGGYIVRVTVTTTTGQSTPGETGVQIP